MYLVLKISKKHPLQILGIFTEYELAGDAVINYHRADSPGSVLVSDNTGYIYSTRDTSGKLLDDDWYVVGEIHTDVIVTDLFADYFSMSLDKVSFRPMSKG